MKRWMISPIKGVLYHKETGAITLDGEGVLSTAWVDRGDRLNLWVSSMSVKFISDDKKIYGWGEHLGDTVWLSDQGGTLEYQKGFYLPVEKREIIQIPIVMIDDENCDYLRNCCFCICDTS